MEKALHVRTTVLPGSKMEIVSPELEAGQTVNVVVLRSSSAERRSASWLKRLGSTSSSLIRKLTTTSRTKGYRGTANSTGPTGLFTSTPMALSTVWSGSNRTAHCLNLCGSRPGLVSSTLRAATS